MTEAAAPKLIIFIQYIVQKADISTIATGLRPSSFTELLNTDDRHLLVWRATSFHTDAEKISSGCWLWSLQDVQASL